MTVTVRIPTPLRRLTNDQDKTTVDGDTLGGVVEAINVQFPGIKDRICDESGDLRNFVNVYINGEDVRFLNGLDTATNPGDCLLYTSPSPRDATLSRMPSSA